MFKTPMMQQYAEIKANNKDALLLFRLGDFYELFLDDAKTASKILGITLTSRNRGSDGRIPMCGIPYHALDSYLHKLIRAGKKVAICEQMEDASQTKNMVKREVVRTVSPGTILNEKNLSQKHNNYILGIEIDKKHLGLAYADLSTGEIYIHQTDFQNLEKSLESEVLKIKPVEIISSHQNYNRPEILRGLRVLPKVNIFPDDNWERATEDFESNLKQHFKIKSFESFGINKKKYQTALKATAGLLNYLKNSQKKELKHINKLQKLWSNEFLYLDPMTISNLELFTNIRGQQGSTLIDVLDQTRTAGGGRLLRKWILNPLQNVGEIKKRQNNVEILVRNNQKRQNLQKILNQILDIERLLSKVSVGTANPRDLIGLKTSLQKAEEISKYLKQKLPKLSNLFENSLINNSKNLTKLLEQSIKNDPPATLDKGGYIANGISAELDEYRDILGNNRAWLKKFEQEQKNITKINNLKVKQNKIFGFYIEISKTQINKVPQHYIRKQTLVNSERYIVPKLKDREERALQAEQKIKTLEKEIFYKILEKILAYIKSIQNIARQISIIDVYTCFAELAEKNNYVKPKIIRQGNLIIKNGWHPVIKQFQPDQPIIPNHTEINPQNSQILLITGPNMAGKSTYLRQTALITLIAQTGCFVPAESAQIPVRDQIYTRVGASDNLSLGQSTFLVEMIETAKILNNCTNKSLVVFDEIGRGTSTFDGMSIAWAVIEYLINNSNKAAYTLFATHYHELTALANKYKQIKNLQMAVTKDKGKIVFLYKVKPGRAWESYGIEVAKLAGLPKEVTNQAENILQKIKKNQKRIKLNINKTNNAKQVKLIK